MAMVTLNKCLFRNRQIIVIYRPIYNFDCVYVRYSVMLPYNSILFQSVEINQNQCWETNSKDTFILLHIVLLSCLENLWNWKDTFLSRVLKPLRKHCCVGAETQNINTTINPYCSVSSFCVGMLTCTFYFIIFQRIQRGSSSWIQQRQHRLAMTRLRPRLLQQ